MNEREYVVLQVWHDRQWLDYSRCTAAQAMAFLAVRGKDFRGVHWISKEWLTPSQIATMAEHPDWFADHAPKESS